MMYTKAKITMTHYDGNGNELETHYINGIVDEYEASVDYPYGYRTTTITIRDNEITRLPIGAKPVQCRCSIEPYKKEDDNMTVKIKKQPIEITLEELKQGNEYEKVIIHINNEKKEEIENKYGIHYRLMPKNTLTDTELEFKEHYIKTHMDNIPYEIIAKVEVVEK